MKLFILLLVTLFLSACAGHGDIVENEYPAYWMTKYASNDQAKINKCMNSANEAYEKAYTGAPMGANGWGVLAKGTEWDRCMSDTAKN